MPHGAIIDRIHHGRSTIVLGGMPDLPDTITAVRVRCDLSGPLAPLERACRRIDRILAGDRSARERILDEDIARPVAQRFVNACNRLAAHAPGKAVLVLDRIEAAGEDAHRFIAQLLRERATFRLPLLLVVRDDPPETFGAVVDAVEQASAKRSNGSIEDRLEHVAELVRSGDAKTASEELGRALDAIDALPAGAEASLLSGRALLERARMRWLGAGVDASFTLDGALEAALAARAALGEAAAPKLRADVAAVIAGIAYDLGDGASIACAAEIVTETIAALLYSGATNDAAMLLNEQAALELRIGRGTKARDLVQRSLALLGARAREAPTDRAARADLAATHHLLGRMPLHGATDEVTPDAIASALAHTKEAEAAYRALGMRRDVGRALETRARLEAKSGDRFAACAAFETALHLANDCVDLTGLARVTAGLAELLADAGKPRDALGLLASSIELNREKASPVGLAYDESALARIEDAIEAMREPDGDLAAELARTRARLARALDLNAVR